VEHLSGFTFTAPSELTKSSGIRDFRAFFTRRLAFGKSWYTTGIELSKDIGPISTGVELFYRSPGRISMIRKRVDGKEE
jgi:hypothetical protein